MKQKKRHITAMISYYVSLCMLIVCSLLLYAAYCCMQSVAVCSLLLQVLFLSYQMKRCTVYEYRLQLAHDQRSCIFHISIV